MRKPVKAFGDGENMKRNTLLPLFVCLLFCFSLWSAPKAEAQEPDLQEELLQKSGAEEMYDSLDNETKGLLSQAGIEKASVDGEGKGLFSILSQLLQEKLAGPFKALASLTAVIILCKLANCFDSSELGGISAFAGALACAAVVVAPLLKVMDSTQRAVESASVFLLASVPVYGGLMAAGGSAAAGTSYSFLALSAANVIPILSSSLIFPMLHVFLALALTASVSEIKLDRLAGSLYGFAKWLLVLAVTLFSGILSVQTMLNAQVDAVGSKTAKLFASAAIPIVGSAFGDAIGAIQNSVHMVKSGVGAFGILAALCIFAPAAMEAAIWTAVCFAGQIIGDIFETPKLSSFLGMCGSAARMVLAVIAATCAVSVVSAAIVLFVKGSL